MDFRITIYTNNVTRFSVPAGYFPHTLHKKNVGFPQFRHPRYSSPTSKLPFMGFVYPFSLLFAPYFNGKAHSASHFLPLFVSNRMPNSLLVSEQRHITAIISFVISFSIVYQSDINVLFASCNALIMDVFVILSFSFTIHSKIGGYPGSARIISNPLE